MNINTRFVRERSINFDAPGGNISQFSEKFWEIVQISLENSRLSPKITE